MARITVEDCLAQVGNRFMLVELARKRSLQLLSGSPPLVEPEGDKPTVIALREIAEKKITEDNIATFGVRDGNYKKEVEEQVTNDDGS